MAINGVLENTFYTPEAPKAKSDLDMSTFLRLLTVQLSTQNPLEPMNDRDFFAQLAQLGQVQGVDKLTKQSEIQQAQSLMGKLVTAVRPTDTSNPSASPIVTGVVQRLSIVNGTYKISIQEADGGIVEVGMNTIQSVQPLPKAADYAYLVGKQAGGLGAAGVIKGKVTSVGLVDGKIVLSLDIGSGKTASLAIENMSFLGE